MKDDVWLINRIEEDCNGDMEDVPIGYFQGTHEQVLDYIKKLNKKSYDIYDYIFLDRLN